MHDNRTSLRSGRALRVPGPSFLLLATALGIAALGAGCNDQSPAQAQAKAPAALPSVSVSQPAGREVIDWDEYTARFDAVEYVEIRARVSGYLTEVAFKDGQEVKKGDKLFIVDPRPFERALEQAEAELFAARTKVDNANLDVDRGKPLVETRVISAKTFDDRMNLLREAQASVRVAEAKVKSAELDLSFTTITSPITGRISRTLVTAGNWISAGSVSGTTLLTTIVSENPIYLYFDVSENNYLKYKRLTEQGINGSAAELGASVEIALPDDKGFPYKAQLNFLDNRLDQGTGTLRARALVKNDNRLFSPGMFARVRIAGSPAYSALLLPESAIGTDQISKYVLVVGEDGSVVRRNVTLGPFIDGRMRVIREGVAATDWVVTNGLQRARPGSKVEPKRVALTVSEAQPLPPVVTKR
ncbi:MAG: efflux RND transporter periplasmic adaptor subunit [Hyphomicrobiales bacterium]|nr:MAG: efflux RND transporter periplasmic adaptor subunit [Hyphomicrobiales bacterium]